VKLTNIQCLQLKTNLKEELPPFSTQFFKRTQCTIYTAWLIGLGCTTAYMKLLPKYCFLNKSHQSFWDESDELVHATYLARRKRQERQMRQTCQVYRVLHEFVRLMPVEAIKIVGQMIHMP
jgi:hypothetical protein